MEKAYPAEQQEVLLATDSIVKIFGGVRALDRVTMSIRCGEVRGLVGENGSGKSTFIKILNGFHKPDRGAVYIRGIEVALPIRLESLPSTYIGFVHQDLGLIGDLSVIENFFIRDIAKSGSGSLRKKFVPRKTFRHHLQECLARFNIPVGDVDKPIGEFSPLTRAMIAIVRAVDEVERSGADKSLLVLDEPTVFLPGDQRQVLYNLIRDITAADSSVLLVSHDIDEVLEAADTVTVFRDGRVVDTVDSSNTTRRSVVEMMVGLSQGRVEAAAAAAESARSAASSTGEPVVTLNGVSSSPIRNATFATRAGEIVGLAGLAGSGYELVTRIIYGVMPIGSGSMTICGEPVQPNRYSPTAAINRGVVLVPRDRIREGGIAQMTVNENVFFPIRSKFTKNGVVNWRAGWNWIRDQLIRFDVRPPDGSREMGTLSGGNQQKAIFAKWAQMDPKVMLLEEPTQGVDVGARAGIWGFIREAASTGCTVIISSSDYEELSELCDRVVIMASGTVVSELPRDQLSKRSILTACYGSVSVDGEGTGS